MDSPHSGQTSERRQKRLPDDHPAVARLKRMRERIVKLRAAVEAARTQNDRELYEALERLDEVPERDPES